MSITSKEISDQHNKIKVEKTKAAPTLSQLSPPIIRLTASFLNNLEFSNLCQATRSLYTPCKDHLEKRKKVNRVIKGLLPHVSVYTIEENKPDPIHQFCNSPDFEIDMILIKAPFSEGYDSKKFQEFVYFRQYKSISALQLAAVSGDKFVLLDLLTRLLKKEHKDKYRVAALQQLEEVYQRIRNQKICLDAVNAIKEIEDENVVVKANAKLRLIEIQQSAEFQKQMKEFISEMDEFRRQISDKVKKIQEMGEVPRQITEKTTKIQKRDAGSPSHHAPELKSETERKVTAENTPIKYADETEVLEPVLNLLKAYIYFYLQEPQLPTQENWTRLDQLWEYMGEWQKRLPHYFKQVFFDGKQPFSISPLPTFEASPARAACRYWNNSPLDLDGLGVDKRVAFGRVNEVVGFFEWGACFAVDDMTVVAHLYKHCITELGKIIEQLRHPEMSLRAEGEAMKF